MEPAPQDLTVRLVGRFAILRAGRELDEQDVGTRKARVLLKLLAVQAPRSVPPDELAEALWPQAPPRRPVDNLATLVSRVRSALGAGVVDGDRAGWRLGSSVRTDLADAAALVAEARRRADGDEPAPALTAGLAATELLADGRLLTEEAGAGWLDLPRAATQQLLREARHLAATAALDVGDPGTALRVAGAAVADDPLDEGAVRMVLRAHAAAGASGHALAVYEELRTTLLDQLGTDPDPLTRALHLELLTESAPDQPVDADPGARPPGRSRRAPDRSVGADSGFVGRADELALLEQAWVRALHGRAGLVLLVGEPGIGKSSLAGELVRRVRTSGGQVLEARCYDAERSLFLQPFVDAVRPEVVRSSPQVLRDLCGDRAPTLASLVPEVGDVLGPLARDPATAETERRLAYEALISLLQRLAARAPLLLVLDDAQNAPLATVELLHLLVRRASTAPLLVLATVRSGSGAGVVSALEEVATTVELGPLDADSVLELAAAHGRRAAGADLLTRTRGHPLFVVESLRALERGEEGLPASLAVTVAQRVRSTGADLERTLRAASVLGTTFAPSTLAGLLAADPVSVAEDCERLTESRLLVAAGSTYEFGNDLVQEIVYADTARPVREAYHRRAADLFADRPEAAASHAEAAGDLERAARSWQAAGLDASRHYAVADGEQLLTRGVMAAEAAERAGAVLATLRLDRGRLRVAIGDFEGALDDFTAALAMAQDLGRRDLELLVDRELGGDVLVGLGRPVSACGPYLEAGLVLAAELGDAVREVDLLSRSSILACNRLQYVRAIADSTRAVALSRRLGEPEAVILALDGLKTAYAYLGDLERLVEVTEELEPLCRRAGPPLQLQWVVFERSFVPMAAGRWDEATGLVEEALALSRRTGWTTFEGWFLAHLGWLARLAGRPDEAVDHGRRAVAVETGRDHPWWRSTACAMLAGSLIARDPGDAREAVRVLRQGLVSADRAGAEAFRLRCLAGLADTTGAPDARDQAQLLLDGLQAPPGRHWMHGTDAVLGLARAWLAAGEPARALAVLDPLARVGAATGWAAFLAASGVDEVLVQARAAAGVPAQSSASSRSAIRSAAPGSTGR